MTAAFRAAGAKVVGTTTGVAVTAPAGVAVGDLEILVAGTIAGGSVTISANGGSAWTAISGSPIDVTGGEKLYVWWRIRQTGDTNPSVLAGSDHFIAARMAVTVGTFDTADPLDVENAAADVNNTTAVSWFSSPLTTIADTLHFCIVTSGADSNTQQVPVMTNANLTALTHRLTNHQTNTGGGGGFGCTTGVRTTAGSPGTWGCTLAGASPKSYVAFAVRPKPPELLETIKDEFDAALNTTLWAEKSAGAIWDAAWGGRLILPVISAYNFCSTASSGGLILTGSSVYCQVFAPVVGANSKEVFFEVIRAGQTVDKVSMYLNGVGGVWKLLMNRLPGGTAQMIDYDPVAHRCWRIRETGGTIYFETSPDAVTWTARHSQPVSWSTDNVYVNFSAGYWGTESASNAYVDNVNMPPSIEPSATLADDFNRADATPPSGSWTGSWAGVWRITSNELNHPTGTWDGLSYTDMVLTTDCVAIWDLVAVGADASHLQLFINRIEADDTGYFVDISPIVGGTQTAYLRRRLLAADSVISGATVTGAQGLAAGDKLALKRVGARIEYWHQKAGVWTLIADATDAAPLTAPGAPGIFANGAFRVDNFAADPLPRGPSISEADSVTTADALTLVADYVLPLADTATGSDALAMDESFVLVDSATPTDALAVDVGVVLADTAVTSDLLTLETAQDLSLADTAVPADALALDVGVTLADATTSTDNLSIDIGQEMALADTATATDALSLAFDIEFADVATAADTPTFVSVYEMAFTDAVGTADTLGVDQVLLVVDTVPLADLLAMEDVLVLGDSIPTSDAILVVVTIDCPVDPMTGLPLSGQAITGYWEACVPNPGMKLGGITPGLVAYSGGEIMDPVTAGLTLGTYLPTAAVYEFDITPTAGLGLGAYVTVPMLDPVPTTGLALGSYLPAITVEGVERAPTAGLLLGGAVPSLQTSQAIPIPSAGLLLGATVPKFVGATLLLPVHCVDTDLEDVTCETPVLTNGTKSISLQAVSEPDLILEEVLAASVSLPDTES